MILRPTNKKYIKLKSYNPRKHPKIIPNYLTTKQNIKKIKNYIKLTKKIFQQKTFNSYKKPKLTPKKNIQSDKKINEYNRNINKTTYHPSYTYKIKSKSNPITIINPTSNKIYDLKNLKIINTSIIPNIINNNLNTPTIIITKKTTNIIIKNKPLPKTNTPIYKPKNLNSQR